MKIKSTDQKCIDCLYFSFKYPHCEICPEPIMAGMAFKVGIDIGTNPPTTIILDCPDYVNIRGTFTHAGRMITNVFYEPACKILDSINKLFGW